MKTPFTPENLPEFFQRMQKEVIEPIREEMKADASKKLTVDHIVILSGFITHAIEEWTGAVVSIGEEADLSIAIDRWLSGIGIHVQKPYDKQS